MKRSRSKPDPPHNLRQMIRWMLNNGYDEAAIIQIVEDELT